MGLRCVKVAVVLIIVTAAWHGVASQGEPDRTDLESLLQERYDTLRKAYTLVEVKYREGRSTLDSLVRVSQLLLQAELEVTDDKAKRIVAHQRFVADVTKLEARLLAAQKIGIVSMTDALEATAKRLAAEIQLARERADDR